MVPIVDAGVGLSQKHFALSDYLNGINQFHVLRMVAVQLQQPVKVALQELNLFQTLATTRGSGGFPNAILASVDLFNPSSIAELASQHSLKNLRGVWYGSGEQYDISKRSEWQRSLTILAENNLTLDLLLTEANDALAGDMAEYQSQLSIIVGIPDVEAGKNQSAIERLQRLTRLSNCPNVYLKISGDIFSTNGAYKVQSTLIDEALALFGFERIMFSSGLNQYNSNTSFDQQWSEYVEACSMLSARVRDSLFRTNAIRVYGL